MWHADAPIFINACVPGYPGATFLGGRRAKYMHSFTCVRHTFVYVLCACTLFVETLSRSIALVSTYHLFG